MLFFSFSMKKAKHIRLIFSVAILIFSPLAIGGRVDTNPNCSYSIEIETTCASFAETKDPIGVRFGDSRGNLVIVETLKNPQMVYGPKHGVGKQGSSVHKGSERCAIDVYEARGVCMSGNVCSLYVKLFGADGWRPGWVKVLRRRDDGQLTLVSDVFYYRRFVPVNVWFGFDYCDTNRRGRGALPQALLF